LHESICKNASKSRSHAADKVEDRIAFLEFVTWIPCTEEVYASRIESGLKGSKNDSENSHDFPRFAEAEGLKHSQYNPQNSLDSPLTIITAPHKKTIEARNRRGPISRIATVAGGWKKAYGRKKTKDTMVYALFFAFIWSCSVILEYCQRMSQYYQQSAYPAIAAAPRFVRSIKLIIYRNPSVKTSRQSTRQMIALCSSGVKAVMRLSVESSRTERSTWSSSPAFSSDVLSAMIVVL
jgi:hypothetical protein